MGRRKRVEQVYQKVSQLDHILLRPDTYIGSIETCNETVFIFNPTTRRIQSQKIEINWGLYKLFDEILVNAADNFQRSKSLTYISVEVDPKKGRISIANDGKGIPISKHKKEKMLVPEMLFGVLLTGSNFDDSVVKTTGGRNGFGGKLANVFSRRFEVEIEDARRGKRYKQVWQDNMKQRGEPQISDLKGSGQGRDCEENEFHEEYDGSDEDQGSNRGKSRKQAKGNRGCKFLT